MGLRRYISGEYEKKIQKKNSIQGIIGIVSYLIVV